MRAALLVLLFATLASAGEVPLEAPTVTVLVTPAPGLAPTEGRAVIVVEVRDGTGLGPNDRIRVFGAPPVVPWDSGPRLWLAVLRRMAEPSAPDAWEAVLPPEVVGSPSGNLPPPEPAAVEREFQRRLSDALLQDGALVTREEPLPPAATAASSAPAAVVPTVPMATKSGDPTPAPPVATVAPVATPAPSSTAAPAARRRVIARSLGGFSETLVVVDGPLALGPALASGPGLTTERPVEVLAYDGRFALLAGGGLALPATFTLIQEERLPGGQ